MPDIQAPDRISRLEAARDAAQSVIDDIERRNSARPLPQEIDSREPTRLQAQGDVDDLDTAIRDEEAATLVVSVDRATFADLQAIAARLDRAIVRTALIAGGLATATTVLNDVAKVKGALNA